MRTTARSVLALALTLSVATATLTAQQAYQRLQPRAPDWQERINEVFGVVLENVEYLPFADIAGWLGIDTAPHRVLDADGKAGTKVVTLAEESGGVQFAAFTSTARRVLAADSRHDVRVFSLFRADWRAQSPDAPDPLLAILHGHTGDLVAVDVFPEAASRLQLTDDFYRRAEILTASQDGTARIWRLCSEAEADPDSRADAPQTTVQREARAILRHAAPLTAACYSPSGHWIATGSSDGTAIVWDQDCKQHAVLKDHQGGVKSLHFASDDRLVVTPVDGAPKCYDPDSGLGAEVPTAASGDDASSARPWFGSALAMAGNNATLTLVDGSTLQLSGHTGTLRGVQLADDHTRALTWSDDGTVRTWDWLVRGPTGAVASVSVPFVVLWLVVAAVLFTLFFRFVNLRMFKHAILCVRGVFSDPKDAGEVSHFQALSAALSATVGLGNIAGVAIAVMIGGPGATFWMILAGLLGMTLKFTECTLGQKFRKIDEHGTVSGGPMHYLRDGLQQKGLGGLGAVLAVIFSIFCIGGSLAGGNAFQVNQSLGILRGQVDFFRDYPWVYGLLMAFFAGIVIIGGIKSIARVADKIVPLMCGIYVLSALVVILMHLPQVPAAFANIFTSALHGDAVYGGAIGALIMGFRRAAFSNEAGVGSASIAHSAARTPYAVREGIVALLEPFIDTVVVCTMTALVIGITGVYNAPEHAEIVAATDGAGLTAEAFKSVGVFRAWFPWLLMVAVVLFAYSTMISWSYYGERCATNLFGKKASLPFKLLFLVFTVLGSVVTATNVLAFGDDMILLMAFPNILGLYLLGGVVKRELAEYEQKLKNGEIRAFK